MEKKPGQIRDPADSRQRQACTCTITWLTSVDAVLHDAYRGLLLLGSKLSGFDCPNAILVILTPRTVCGHQCLRRWSANVSFCVTESVNDVSFYVTE